jgi:hypothetical protein
MFAARLTGNIDAISMIENAKGKYKKHRVVVIIPDCYEITEIDQYILVGNIHQEVQDDTNN